MEKIPFCSNYSAYIIVNDSPCYVNILSEHSFISISIAKAECWTFIFHLLAKYFDVIHENITWKKNHNWYCCNDYTRPSTSRHFGFLFFFIFIVCFCLLFVMHMRFKLRPQNRFSVYFVSGVAFTILLFCAWRSLWLSELTKLKKLIQTGNDSIFGQKINWFPSICYDNSLN